MTKAVFTREFHWNRPGSNIGFGARPKVGPQNFPRDFIAAAVRAGAATEVRDKARNAGPERPDPLAEMETDNG